MTSDILVAMTDGVGTLEMNLAVSPMLRSLAVTIATKIVKTEMFPPAPLTIVKPIKHRMG